MHAITQKKFVTVIEKLKQRFFQTHIMSASNVEASNWYDSI